MWIYNFDKLEQLSKFVEETVLRGYRITCYYKIVQNKEGETILDYVVGIENGNLNKIFFDELSEIAKNIKDSI